MIISAISLSWAAVAYIRNMQQFDKRSLKLEKPILKETTWQVSRINFTVLTNFNYNYKL